MGRGARRRYSDDSRRYRLLADVMQTESSVGDKALLNVVLEPCRQECRRHVPSPQGL